MRNLFLHPADRTLLRKLKAILGFQPRHLSFYKRALVHRSVSGEGKESNERLEYLGDAVFGAIVAHYLYKRFPFKDEGFLTQMRSRMVNRSYLNQLAKKLTLDTVVEHVKDRHITASSLYGDAFEALIGAIYLDRGFVFTQKFIEAKIIKLHMDVEHLEVTDTDYKSRLINWAQRERKKLTFAVIGESGTGRDKVFIVAAYLDGETVATARDISKKKAEQLVAKLAVEKLGII